MQRYNCMHTASTGSSRGLQNPQGACQGGGGERGEEEVDYVGSSLEASGQEQHIKSFSMDPAQHKQSHCLMAIHFINYEVSFVKLELPGLELVESTQAAPFKQPRSKQL